MRSALRVVEHIKAAMELQGSQVSLNWRQTSVDFSPELVCPFDLAVREVMIDCSCGIHTVNIDTIFKSGTSYHGLKAVPGNLMKIILPSVRSQGASMDQCASLNEIDVEDKVSTADATQG